MMKVIFIKDLRGQGKVHDIKEVSDGYAVNYLIKNGYAVKYTKTSSNILDVEIDNINKKDMLDRENANILKNKLEKESIIFDVKTGKDGKVFGTISSKQISEELNKRNYNIDKKKIVIDGVINSLGNHYVKVSLYKDIYADVNIKLIEK